MEGERVTEDNLSLARQSNAGRTRARLVAQ